MGRKRAYPEQHSGIPACPQVRIEAVAASISHTVNPQKPIIGSMAVAETRSGATEMTAGRPGTEYLHSELGLHWERSKLCRRVGRRLQPFRTRDTVDTNVAWRTHRSQATSGAPAAGTTAVGAPLADRAWIAPSVNPIRCED